MIRIPLEEYRYINYGIIICALSISLVACIIIRLSSRIEQNKAFYKSIIGIINVLMICSYLLELISTEPDLMSGGLLGIAIFFQFLLPCVMAMVFVCYLSSLFQDKTVAFLNYCLLIFETAALFLNLILPWIYHIDSNLNYHRADFYLLYQFIGILQIFLALYLILKDRVQLNEWEFLVSLGYLAFPFLGVCIQTFFLPHLFVLIICSTFSVLLISIWISFEQTNQYKEAQNALTDSQMKLLLVQLRPHFVSNALSSISQLCKKDPDLAAEMVDRFADFLNKNLRDAECKKLILFKEERLHIEHYLMIEKMRFGDRLNVNWGIECDDFYLPPMILQPIVENSVKHGIMQKDEGGTISILSRKIGDSYMITISDDGVGFDEKQIDGKRVHIGLENVRKRLALIKGAELMLHSEVGNGTTITIILPGSVKNDENCGG